MFKKIFIKLKMFFDKKPDIKRHAKKPGLDFDIRNFLIIEFDVEDRYGEKYINHLKSSSMTGLTIYHQFHETGLARI